MVLSVCFCFWRTIFHFLTGALALWFWEIQLGCAGVDILFDGSDEAHHRLRDAIHGARILADSGAGYEAAMVLTAISIQAKNTELAEEALNILNNLELTPNSVLNGTAKEILGKNQKRNHRHHSNFNKRHIQNLIKLGLYSEAADQLLRILKSNKIGRASCRERV